MTIQLRESTAEAPVKAGKRWRVIVARPGVGSSGTYSEEMFRRDAHKIIAPGGQAFINHDETRNPKDMLGTYPEGSFWSEEDKAVVSELEVFSHWADFVEEVGPHCGISLYAMGEADDEGNVTAIIEDRLNGADLVARPGLIGSGLAEKLYESAVAGSDTNPPVTSAEAKEKEIKLDEKDREKLDALVAAVATLVADKEKATAEAAQVTADAEAGRNAVEAYDAAVTAIDKAELPEAVVESLRAQAKEGVDVTPLIAQAVAMKEAFEARGERLNESSQGRDFGSKAETKLGAWK